MASTMTVKHVVKDVLFRAHLKSTLPVTFVCPHQVNIPSLQGTNWHASPCQQQCWVSFIPFGSFGAKTFTWACPFVKCCDHRQNIKSVQMRVKIRSALRNTAPSRICKTSPMILLVSSFLRGGLQSIMGASYIHILTEQFTEPISSTPRLPVMPRTDWKFQKRIKRTSDVGIECTSTTRR